MLRVLHLSDMHLGAPLSYLGDKSPARQKDLEDAFSRAIEFASIPENRIDLVIIAGDLFDSHNPSTHLLQMVKAKFSMLHAKGIPVALVPGTHDSYTYATSVYRNSDNFPGVILLHSPNIAEPVDIQIGGQPVYLYGMVWDRYESIQPFDRFSRQDREGIHIAIIHGSIIEKIPQGAETLDPEYVPLSYQRLLNSGMHYIALGHYHNFDSFGNNRIVYPGTLEGLDFTETGERYLVVAEISQNGVSIEKHKFNKRTLKEINLDVSGFETLDAVEKYIARLAEEDGTNTLLRLRLTGIAPELDIDEHIREKFADKFFFLDVLDDTDILHSEIVNKIATEPGVRGEFVRLLREKINTTEDIDKKSLYQWALKIGLTELIKRS